MNVQTISICNSFKQQETTYLNKPDKSIKLNFGQNKIPIGPSESFIRSASICSEHAIGGLITIVGKIACNTGHLEFGTKLIRIGEYRMEKSEKDARYLLDNYQLHNHIGPIL